MRWIAKSFGDSRPFTVAIRDDAIEIVWAMDDGAASSPATWSQAERLSQLLHVALASGAATIIVDLHDAGDANTALLAVLIDASSLARRAHAALVLRGSPALLQLAEVCRLEAVLTLD